MSLRPVGSTGNLATIRIFTDDGTPAPGLALHSNGATIKYKRQGSAAVTIPITGAPTPNYTDVGDGSYEIAIPNDAYASATPRLTIEGTLTNYVIIPDVQQVGAPAVNVTAVGGTAVNGPNALKADVSALALESTVNAVGIAVTQVGTGVTNLGTRIPDALEGGRIKAVATVSTAGLATEATQLAILAQTSLIGTGAVSVTSPVRQDGTLNDLVVGDAYQQATGRAIQITITGVSAGLQTALATATVHLGFRAFGKSRQSPEFRRYEFAGTIVSVGASTVVRFELTTAQTKAILPGRYDYDIEFRTGGNYLTEVASVEDAPMSWLESSTTLPS
jgi:hypothetical protein